MTVTGERIPEIDFEPLEKLIQWSCEERTVKRLLDQELNELAERRGETVEADISKNLEAEAPQTTSYEVRRYEEENDDGNDELEKELLNFVEHCEILVKLP